MPPSDDAKRTSVARGFSGSSAAKRDFGSATATGRTAAALLEGFEIPIVGPTGRPCESAKNARPVSTGIRKPRPGTETSEDGLRSSGLTRPENPGVVISEERLVWRNSMLCADAAAAKNATDRARAEDRRTT